LQADFPNRRHQTALWDFVGSCSNLECLSIEATHFLDLDKLKWLKSAQSRGLRSLSLSRIWTSISSMQELVRPHTEATNSPQLQCITFSEVKVHTNGGDWYKFFSYLRNDCPDFVCCKVERLTYFSEHPHFEWNNRISENYNVIWTERGEDWDELRELTRQLVRKAGGEDLYPETCLECLECILDD
ncbi:hypothetical protein EDB81DRAFT_670689, partial [Dactylonectria macrodidyma]